MFEARRLRELPLAKGEVHPDAHEELARVQPPEYRVESVDRKLQMSDSGLIDCPRCPKL